MSAVLETLYRENRPALVRYATSRVGPDLAEDAVQDAAEALLRSALGPEAGLGHAIRAVWSAALHLRRSEWRARRRLVRVAREPSVPGALEDAVCARVVLAAFLAALPRSERTALLRLALCPGRQGKTVWTYASRARRRLRALGAPS